MWVLRAVLTFQHPRLVFRIHNQLVNNLQNRNLFSSTFHLLDVTEKQIYKERAATKDSLVYKDTIVSYGEKGRVITVAGITKYLLLSEGVKDLNFGLYLINRTISADLKTHGYSEGTFDLIWLFLRICFIQNLPVQATMAWNDPVIRSTQYTLDRARLARLYFDLLFINNMYNKVLDSFNKDFEKLVSKFDCVKLTCISCYKLGTVEALEEGLKILSHPSCVIDTPTNRSYQALALLAYKLHKFSIAYNLLVKYGSLNTKDRSVPLFNRSLMLMVLADMGELEEAMTLLHTGICIKKKKFNYFAIEKLLEAAKTADKDQIVNSIQKLRLLPPNYDIWPEEGLEQMLLKQIKPNMRHSKTPQTPFTFSI